MPAQANDAIRGQLTWNTLPNLITDASVRSLLGKPLVLRLPIEADSLRITPEGGKHFTVKARADGGFEFATKAGTIYQISW